MTPTSSTPLMLSSAPSPVFLSQATLSLQLSAPSTVGHPDPQSWSQGDAPLPKWQPALKCRDSCCLPSCKLWPAQIPCYFHPMERQSHWQKLFWFEYLGKERWVCWKRKLFEATSKDLTWFLPAWYDKIQHDFKADITMLKLQHKVLSLIFC